MKGKNRCIAFVRVSSTLRIEELSLLVFVVGMQLDSLSRGLERENREDKAIASLKANPGSIPRSTCGPLHVIRKDS